MNVDPTNHTVDHQDEAPRDPDEAPKPAAEEQLDTWKSEGGAPTAVGNADAAHESPTSHGDETDGTVGVDADIAVADESGASPS